MGGHWHDARAGTQNQGNHIGDRSCVRQSKLYRKYESGNQVKDLLGQGSLKWNENKKQGAYAGQKVYDHSTADHSTSLRGGGQSVNRAAVQPAPEPAPNQGYGAAPWAVDPPTQGYGGASQGYGGASKGHGGASQGYGAAIQGYGEARAMEGYGAALEQQFEAMGARSAPMAAPMGGQGWTNLAAARAQPPPSEFEPRAAAPGMAKGRVGGGSRRTMEVEVQFREGDHQFGKTTAASVLSTRPW